MNYVLQRHLYHADVLVKGASRPAARVYTLLDEAGLHPVCDDQGRFLFAVRRIEDAISELEKYCRNHPPPWQPVYTTLDQKGLPKLFIRRTPFAELRIQQTWDGNWFALRDGEPLHCRRGIATFRSCEEAQRLADKHLCDRSKRLTNALDYWWTDPEEEQELDRKIGRLLPR